MRDLLAGTLSSSVHLSAPLQTLTDGGLAAKTGAGGAGGSGAATPAPNGAPSLDDLTSNTAAATVSTTNAAAYGLSLSVDALTMTGGKPGGGQIAPASTGACAGSDDDDRLDVGGGSGELRRAPTAIRQISRKASASLEIPQATHAAATLAAAYPLGLRALAPHDAPTHPAIARCPAGTPSGVTIAGAGEEGSEHEDSLTDLRRRSRPTHSRHVSSSGLAKLMPGASGILPEPAGSQRLSLLASQGNLFFRPQNNNVDVSLKPTVDPATPDRAPLSASYTGGPAYPAFAESLTQPSFFSEADLMHPRDEAESFYQDAWLSNISIRSSCHSGTPTVEREISPLADGGVLFGGTAATVTPPTPSAAASAAYVARGALLSGAGAASSTGNGRNPAAALLPHARARSETPTSTATPAAAAHSVAPTAAKLTKALGDFLMPAAQAEAMRSTLTPGLYDAMRIRAIGAPSSTSAANEDAVSISAESESVTTFGPPPSVPLGMRGTRSDTCLHTGGRDSPVVVLDYIVGRPESPTQFGDGPDGKREVRCGTLNGLVQQLAAEGAGNQAYLVDFLRTYRYFATALDVARLLALRYVDIADATAGKADAALPKHDSKSKKSKSKDRDAATPFAAAGVTASGTASGSPGDSAEWSGFLQLRVLNVFKKWLDAHPEDFLSNPTLQHFLRVFVEHVQRDPRKAMHATSLLSKLEDKLASAAVSTAAVASSTTVAAATTAGATAASVTVSSALSAAAHGWGVTSSTSTPTAAGNSAATIPTTATLAALAPVDWTESQRSLQPSLAPGSHGSVSTSTEPLSQSLESRGPVMMPQLAASSAVPSTTSSLASFSAGMGSSRFSMPHGDSEFFNLTLGSLRLKTWSRTPSREPASPSAAASLAAATPLPALPTPASQAAATGGPSHGLREAVLHDVDPVVLAEQLTLIEHEHFRRIPIHEFFCQSWNDKHSKDRLAPNLVAFIRFFNRVAYGVATEMVLTTPIKRRVTLLKRLIYVAHLCQQANNYNSVFEIVAGLNLGAVARLKRTWKMLPKKYWDVWIRLDKFVSAEGSYRNYRNHLRQLRESNPGCPVVPYLGVNMSDLTFSEDGNPTLMAHDDTLINFGKFQLISRGFDQILELQRNQYPYRVDALLGDYLRRRWEAVDETTLYEYSFACEARHSSLSPT